MNIQPYGQTGFWVRVQLQSFNCAFAMGRDIFWHDISKYLDAQLVIRLMNPKYIEP